MEEADAADFANYFYSYAELDHQKQMLEDDRCGARVTQSIPICAAFRFCHAALRMA